MSNSLDLSFLRCKVEYDQLSQINTSLGLELLEERCVTYDNLLVAEYPNKLVLDVSWHTIDSFTNGDDGGPYEIHAFLASIFRNKDTNLPAVRWLARDFDELIDVLKRLDDWAMSVKS